MFSQLCVSKNINYKGTILTHPIYLKYGLKHVHGQELPPYAIHARIPLEEQVKGEYLYLCIPHDEFSLLTPDIVWIIKQFKSWYQELCEVTLKWCVSMLPICPNKLWILRMSLVPTCMWMSMDYSQWFKYGRNKERQDLYKRETNE